MFKPRIKKVDFDFKLKLNGKALYLTKYVKYLGIKIDKSLTWDEPINNIAIKLNPDDAMLYKVSGIWEYQGSKINLPCLF